MSALRQPAGLLSSDEEYDVRNSARWASGYINHPNFSAQAARIRANHRPAPWTASRTASEFLFPQTAGDVAVEAAMTVPMPPHMRVLLAASGMLLGSSSEAQGSPLNRIGRRAATAAARAARDAEASVARAAREGWGRPIEAPAEIVEVGPITVEPPGIGHNNPPPGLMPDEEAMPQHGPLDASPGTSTDPAIPSVETPPSERPNGLAVPGAQVPPAAAADPAAASAASPGNPVGAQPTDDLTPPEWPAGPARDAAERLGQAALDSRRAQKALPRSQRVQPRPQDSVFDDPQPGTRLPGVTQQAANDLRTALQPSPSGHPRSGPFSALAGNANSIADRIASDINPDAVRLMRGEPVSNLSASQLEAARAAAGAAQFFNMRPFYDALIGLGFTPQDALRRVQQEARALAATSPRSDTLTNQRSAALLQYLRRLLAREERIDRAALRRLIGPGSGFHLMYSRHSAWFEEMMRGAARLEQHPKTGSFDRALEGDLSAVPVDVHNFRATNMVFNDLHPGQLPREAFRTRAGYERYRAAYTVGPDGTSGPGLDDLELRRSMVTAPPSRHVGGQVVRDSYLVYHDITSAVARRLGVSPAEAQALMWFHYGARTGLASRPRTATQILDERISVTAQLLGIPPRDVLALYARNAIPLAGVGGIAAMGPLNGLLDPQEDARR